MPTAAMPNGMSIAASATHCSIARPGEPPSPMRISAGSEATTAVMSPPATTVPSFPDFPLGVTEGSFEGTLDLTRESSFNPAFLALHGDSVAAAEAALAAGLSAGEAYFNIHTTQFGGGEIRGTLRAVPEPQALSAVGLALVMLIAARTRH